MGVGVGVGNPIIGKEFSLRPLNEELISSLTLTGEYAVKGLFSLCVSRRVHVTATNLG